MDLICNVKNKNGGDSWGTLHGRLMERLAFYYDRHEEIARYIWMRHIYYHPVVMRVFCLPLKFFGWFCYSRHHRVQFNTYRISLINTASSISTPVRYYSNTNNIEMVVIFISNTPSNSNV